MDKPQLMSKPANKPKPVNQGREPAAVYSERVYWGLVGEGGDAPEMLVKDRKFAEMWLGTLPPDLQSKATLVRTYVTVWQLDRARPVKRPGKRARV